jgi:hypothetical protein
MAGLGRGGRLLQMAMASKQKEEESVKKSTSSPPASQSQVEDVQPAEATSSVTIKPPTQQPEPARQPSPPPTRVSFKYC